jgi:CRP/FNR family transcriptional regulator, cyclic AMP receptor protein
MAAVEDAINRVPLFGGLSKHDRKSLAASLKERTFPAGTVITDVGQSGFGFFVIDSGTATVVVGGKSPRTLKAGDHFGEIALIDSGPRTATVTADTDLHCYGMTVWDFRPFVQAHPDVAWALLQTFAKMLRDHRQE